MHCYDYYRMPLTPVTALLFDPAYVQLEYPILAARLRESHSDVVVSNKKFQPECAANKCQYCALFWFKVNVFQSSPFTIVLVN